MLTVDIPIVCETSAAGLGALGVVIVCANITVDILRKEMATISRNVNAFFMMIRF